MSEKKRKTCAVCGGEFVPSSNVQKYCPVCRNAMKTGASLDKRAAYVQAAKPGPVLKYTIEPKKTQEAEATKPIDKPDWEAFLDQAHEVLLAYGRGELVDKNEFLARIRERFDEL